MNINYKLTVEKIKNLESKIRKHKRNCRRKWPPFGKWNYQLKKAEWPVLDDLMQINGKVYHPSSSQVSCLALKEQITVLYALVAHSRGKVHLQGATLEKQKKFLMQNKKQLEEHILKEVE